MSDLVPNASRVARREYLHRVRSRAFIVSTALLAVIALAAGLSPIVMRSLDRGSTARLAITVRATDLVIDPVATANVVLNAGALTPDQAGRRAYDIEAVPDEATAVAGVRAGRFVAALVIDRAPSGKLGYDLVSNLSASGRQTTILKLAAVWLSIEDGLQRAGLAPSASGGPYEAFTVTPADPAASAAPSDVQAVGSYVVAIVLVILIFMTVLTYGMWVAVSVVEEKSSRVMELMLTAASPSQLLAGKVVGVGAAGLTQYVAIVGAALGAILLQQPLERIVFGDARPGDGPLAGLTLAILAAFVLFFLLGFLLYALLYAAAGSLVSRQEDVQQVAMPMIVLALVGYFAASFAANSPEASWVAPLSLVPFFSPYLMLVRIVLGTVAPWEIAAAVGLLVVAIALATWFAARVYRVGVLMYGQRPTLRSYAAAFRLSR